MAAVAADLEAAPELLDTELGRYITIAERARKHGSAIVDSVAGLALRGPATFDRAVVVGGPLRAGGVHPMRPAICSMGRQVVARNAISDHARVILDLETLDIVVRMNRRILRVRRTMARLALQVAVAGGKSIQG